MQIQLSDHFNYKKLLTFTLPSILMMIFTSIYGVVDGFFVSNFVGKTPFAAVNFIYPVIMILGSCGFMIGSGGCALVSKILGEGNKEKASKVFSLLVYFSILLGIILAIIGFLCIRPLAKLLGAKETMQDDCVLYGRIIFLALPAFVLQMEFQSFFIAAEKPKLGLAVTLAAGCTNVLLDGIFICLFKWGLTGAALATSISQVIGGIVPLIYFFKSKKSILRLTKTHFDKKVILKTCYNGSSELMSNISASLVGILYNAQLMKYAGEDGVAAYGVLMYVNMIFIAIFIGYSIGTAPITSYHYGANNQKELQNIFKKSIIIIGVCSLSMVILSEVLAKPLSFLFVSYDDELLSMTLRGFLIFSFSFLFSGLSIFSSSFFTALNDGLTSAIISFLRTLIFQIASVLVLPLFFQLDGIWFSIVLAELLSFIISIFFLFLKKKKYHY